MFIIGITGGTGAGKTSLVNVLKSFGALLLDCDAIYHELLLNNTDMIKEIETRFDGVFTDGRIDRRKLGEAVWNDPASLCDLNTITHKYIGKEMERRINSFKAKGGNLAAIDAIALIESGQSERCDVVVGVTAPREKRLSRIIDRDGLTKEQALMRINAQQPEKFYKDNCDHILENAYDTQSVFEDKCKEFIQNLLKNQKSYIAN